MKAYGYELNQGEADLAGMQTCNYILACNPPCFNHGPASLSQLPVSDVSGCREDVALP